MLWKPQQQMNCVAHIARMTGELDPKPEEDKEYLDWVDSRVPKCPKVIDWPKEGEPNVVCCYNKLIAPYIFAKVKERIEACLGPGSASSVKMAFMSFSSLRKIQKKERDIHGKSSDTWEIVPALFDPNACVLFCPRPDNLPAPPTFWTDLEGLQEHLHIFPPISNIIMYVDPANTWQHDLQTFARLGFVNDYILKHHPKSKEPPANFVTKSWLGYYVELKNEVIRPRDHR